MTRKEKLQIVAAILLAIVVCILVTFSTGCASRLDKAATLANYENVRKISIENDAFVESSNYPESLKLSAQMRNEEARDLAREMAISTGNKVPEDDD